MSDAMVQLPEWNNLSNEVRSALCGEARFYEPTYGGDIALAVYNALRAALLPSDGNWVVEDMRQLVANLRKRKEALADMHRVADGILMWRAADAIETLIAASPSPSVAPDAKSGRTEE